MTVLVFAASDKGGTCRSVTSCNIAYHLAQRDDVAYLDFDFGSPTSGAIFEVPGVEAGVEPGSGMHSYIEGNTVDPTPIDVWQDSRRRDLRTANTFAGRLVLYPGEKGGAEFPMSPTTVTQCVNLFGRLEREFKVSIIDLSAGRSGALAMALMATANPALHSATVRWLVFHRWTRQNVLAASGLVNDPRGILSIGEGMGHDRSVLENSIRFVRTAVPDLQRESADTSAAQAAWLKATNAELKSLATKNKLGVSRTLGQTPVERVLQWREQVISDTDVSQQYASQNTIESFRELARKLDDDAVWEQL